MPNVSTSELVTKIRRKNSQACIILSDYENKHTHFISLPDILYFFYHSFKCVFSFFSGYYSFSFFCWWEFLYNAIEVYWSKVCLTKTLECQLTFLYPSLTFVLLFLPSLSYCIAEFPSFSFPRFFSLFLCYSAVF